MNFKILPMITKPNTYCLYRFNTQEEIEIRLTYYSMSCNKSITEEEKKELFKLQKSSKQVRTYLK